MTSVAMHPVSTGIDRQVPVTVSIAAAVALIATVPLATMIARPLQGLVEAAPGSAANPVVIASVLMAPLGYVLFAAVTWTALHGRADQATMVHTMRVIAHGLVPYVVLSLTGIGWQSGPRAALLVAAALTVPAAAACSIWASARVPAVPA